jgi:hypothetical protein
MPSVEGLTKFHVCTLGPSDRFSAAKTDLQIGHASARRHSSWFCLVRPAFHLCDQLVNAGLIAADRMDCAVHQTGRRRGHLNSRTEGAKSSQGTTRKGQG